MKTDVISEAKTLDDARLVELGLGGNREAFGELVTRYQSPVCALAYSACGDISQSEDLAQETFVVAWRKLKDLKEPAKFKSWLFGIVRNLLNNTFRARARNPLAAAEPLDENMATPATAPNPAKLAISKEEEAILWRSLEQVPETYREPLILFYREHQSIQQVAEILEVTEETARQRLSRGRKLLQEQVTAFVEGALSRTNPGQAFTLGVLAALPIMLASSTKAATLVAAAKGGATVTGTSVISVVLGILTGPALGFLAGFLSWREWLKNGRTPRERTSIKRYGLTIVAGGIVFSVACVLFSGYLSPRLWDHHPVLVLALGWALMMAWVVFAFGFAWQQRRVMVQLRETERQNHPELFRDEVQAERPAYRSRATLFGLPLIHWQSFGQMRKPGEKIPPAIGWIACGERAYGILYATGGVAVGGIATGGLSIGVFAFGWASIGLFAFGGLAIGALALGGGAIGFIASGGMALGWHAAWGGMVAAHNIACGGAALGNHVNDSVARQFYSRHQWLDFARSGSRNVFWLLCFGPMFVQTMIWIWWRRKMVKRTTAKFITSN
jgi:RNA polymerase sigma factor (sigma-70 family)